MHRVFICGGPRSGKTTFGRRLSAELGVPLIQTDDYIGKHNFEDVPDAVLKDLPYAYVLEGVQTTRIIRRLLRRGVLPDCKVYYLTANHGREIRHQPMRMGIAKIWREIVPQLRSMEGVVVEEL